MSTLLLVLAWLAIGDPDGDGDGLSDFQELHKYFTDPARADSDGDGVPDGDWDERREFSYSVRAVLHVMAPFDVASMNDDYQDVRVLEQRPDLLEFEAIVYPFNTVAQTIVGDANWREPRPELEAYCAPGTCCNWDEALRAQLLSELASQGIDLAALDDAEAARAVSKWLMDRAAFEDSFTTFAVEFEGGVPRVSRRQQSSVDETLRRSGRTLAQQFERELFGKGMFEEKVHGSCTSSAIYLSTGLKAAGLPTRTILCIPVVDANDEREVAWIDARIAHTGVRSLLRRAAEEQRGSWTSHTFNEVFVGGRWRRLNYTQLGQNVVDPGSLGLMVHVHTFTDHAQAGLVGWGDRASHPLHAALFGGPNPYSCVSLSDLFGVHATIPNEPLAALREARITRTYWYDDPARDPQLTTNLEPRNGRGFLFAHIESDTSFQNRDYIAFYGAVDRHFVLRAPGLDDVPAEGLHKYWVNTSEDVNDFILQIPAPAHARMAPGVEYALVWEGEGRLRWTVADGVKIGRPGR